VEAGSGAEEGDGAAAGANGRSLLVRVPFAERVRVVDGCAADAAGAAGDVGFDEPALVPRAALVGVLADGADGGFFAPTAVAPLWDARPVVDPDRVDPERGVTASVGAAARFGADVDGFLVGFSALMEQRYAVFSARRESDPGPPTPGTGPAVPGRGTDSTARRGPRAVHFPALWASWAGPSRSSWSSR
jgi:hypothetical protein